MSTQRSGSNSKKIEFWQLSLQEVSRIRRFIDKSTGKVNLPQKTIEGVVHLQTRLHAPIDSQPTLLVIVTFPVTYLKVVLPRLAQLQSTVIAPQTKHLEDAQRVRMASEALPFAVPLPDCPRVQAAFCAGILHPEGADRVIPMPSIKYGLEVVLPTLAEIPQSQASLKEGALLQPAKHPLLPDSQYLWQVTLVQQKEFGSYEAHQNSRVIPLIRTDYACSRLSPEKLKRTNVEGRPVKATNRGQPWKEAVQLNSFSRAPGASLGKAALCLPHWIEQCRWDSMRLAWTPTRPNALPAGRSRTAETYLFANSNQFEPVQHAQQTKLVFRSHSLFLSPRLPVFLPFRCLRS